jgi:hypothetical protein
LIGQGRRAALVLTLVLPLLGVITGCGIDRDAVATGARTARAQDSGSSDQAATPDTDLGERVDTDTSVSTEDSFDIPDSSTDSAETDATTNDPSNDPVDSPESKANRAEVLAAVKGLEDTGSAKITGTSDVSPGKTTVNISADGVMDFRTGDASISEKIMGDTLEIRVVDGVTYMKEPGTKPGDKPWTKLPGSTGAAAVRRPSLAIKQITRNTVITKKAGQVIDGVPGTVYEAKDPDNPEAGYRFYVDSAGRLFREDQSAHLDGTKMGSTSTTTFTEFGAPVHVEAPPPDQVQDFNDVFSDDSGTDSS